MTSGWSNATKMMATVALAAFGALSIGCGPAPGYEAEPRVPVGYAPAQEPATAAELQAQAEARAQAQGEIAVGEDADEYADTDPSALTEFKPALEGHGAWVDDSTYGNVWVPSEAEVGTDFVPYTTAGHWTYDDGASWVWVSDYSWGWAPFHYGRWVHVSRHGWVWIPGRTYSGAWVVWRTGPGYDYIGWAPLGPSWYWYNGVAVGWTYGYSPYYSYCHRQYIYDTGVSTRVVRGPAAREHEGRTAPYVAATPSVAGGGRVAATPSVGGSDRIAASPAVGARTPATPGVGPRPAELGIRNEAVAAPPSDHAGLARARTFASPQSAVAQGAAPPVTATRRRPFDGDSVAAASPRERAGFERAPAGAGGSNRFEAAARAPQVQGVNPVPPRQAALPEMRPTPRSGFAAQTPQAPGYSGPPAQQQPSYRASPSVSSPPPSFSQQQPSYRPSPSVSSPPPSYRSSPSPSFGSSSPAVRSSPSPSFGSSSPTFRSSPSVSSPPPSFRSSPSVSSPSRSASPSIRSSPSPARPSTPSTRRR